MKSLAVCVQKWNFCSAYGSQQIVNEGHESRRFAKSVASGLLPPECVLEMSLFFPAGQPWYKLEEFKPFSFLPRERGRLSMMNTSLMLNNIWLPLYEKIQDTYRRGFLLGHFSVRKCSQLTSFSCIVYSRRSQEVCGLWPGSGRCHVRVQWGLSSHLTRFVLQWPPPVTPRFLSRERSRYLCNLFDWYSSL